MRFSAWPTNQQPFDELMALCHHAEATGWDGVWIADHLMAGREPLDLPVVECWTTVGAVAAQVPRVRIGTLVSGNTFRHPGVLAKMAATVDEISGGRLVLGLGAGWQQNEHEAFGIELPAPRERLERLDEACQVVKRLLSEDRASFDGRYYTLSEAVVAPRPVRGTVPLLVGVKGEQRALRVAARHADEWNLWADPEAFAHKSSVLDRHCEEVGRDPAAIERSAQALLYPEDEEGVPESARAMRRFLPSMGGSVQQLQDLLGAYAEAGLDELVVPDFTFSERGVKLEAYDRFITEVAAPFRETEAAPA